MTSYVMSGLKMTKMPTQGNERTLEHEIAEVDGRPTRCFFTWDIVLKISSDETAIEEDRTKRIIMTEPLTGHEAVAWRRVQRIEA